MKRTWLKLALTGIAALAPTGNAVAADYTWNVLGGGAQTWQAAANWTPNTAFPSTVSDYASLAVPLTGPLTLDIGATNVTSGRLDIGSTGAAVLTDIVANTPNTFLALRNTDDANFNDDTNGVDGQDFLIWQQNLGAGPGATNAQGDANGDGFVKSDDLRIWRQYMTGSGGAALITSSGVAGATNRISAPMLSGDANGVESIDVRGTHSLDIVGGIRVVGVGNAINSFLPTGSVLTISSINTVDQADGLTNRQFLVNNNQAAGGRVEIASVTGGGNLQIGSTTNSVSPISTVVLPNANAGYSGTLTLNRARLIIGNDLSLGTGAFSQGNPSNKAVYSLESNNGPRTMPGRLRLGQFITFTGTNSFTWTNLTSQSNNRGLINDLSGGATLTLAGDVYAQETTMGNNTDAARTIIFDGPGTTIVTGTIKAGRLETSTLAEELPGGPAFAASIQHRGTGELRINGTASYTGNTLVDGGNVTFATYNDTVASASLVVNVGALGANTYNSFATPSTMQTDALFLSRVAPASTGALVIDEANGTYDYNGALAVVPNIGLAAPVGGLTFNGTIVPTALNPNYKLGGGSGTLTLPNAQLTGANNLIVTNGGTVVLGGLNTYTGTTSVLGKIADSLTYVTPTANTNSNADTRTYIATTVLSVSNLQNGGVNSNIGASSNAAANLVIQGSTLRYTGAGASTDRLFTIGQLARGNGSGGATIESSGAGALTFSNTGTIAVLAPTTDVAATTTLTLGGTNTGNNTLAPVIVNGTTATNLVKADAGKWILTGANTYTGTTAVNGGTLLVNGSHTGGGAYTVASGATLGGTGTIGANLTVNGILSPGASVESLAVTGNVTLNAGSTTLIEIGGATAGLYDEFNVAGSIAAGGTFDVDLINGFNPVAGNSFDVLDFNQITGSFSLSLPSLGVGLAWNTSQLLNTGTISVVAAMVSVPEPTSLVMGTGALALVALRRRRGA